VRCPAGKVVGPSSPYLSLNNFIFAVVSRAGDAHGARRLFNVLTFEQLAWGPLAARRGRDGGGADPHPLRQRQIIVGMTRAA